MSNNKQKDAEELVRESQAQLEFPLNKPFLKAKGIRSILLRYGLAVGLFAITLGISLLLSHFEIKINLTILLVTVLVATSWYGGRGPGILLSILVLATALFRAPITPDASIAKAVFAYLSILSLLVFIVLLISGRRSVNGQLRESEARYRHLFEGNPLPMWVYELETFRFLAVNDAAVFSYGYSREEFLSMTIKNIRLPEYMTALLKDVSKQDSKVKSAEILRHRKKDGSIIDVEITSHELIFDGRPSRLVLVNDITERKQAEDAIVQLNATLELRVTERTAQLKAAARRESVMIENALDVICTIDAKGTFVSVNPASFKVWGYKPEEIIGRKYIELVAPEDVPKTKEVAVNIISGAITTDFENRYQRKDGSLVDTMWAAYWSDSEQLMFCVARDITERKRMEEELKRREAQLIEAQRIAHIGSWEWEIENDKISWSDEVYRIFGLKPQEFEVTFESYLNYIHPEDREMVSNIVSATLQTNVFPTYDHRIVRPDGTTRICNAVGNIILNEHGKPVKMIGISQDITERKEAEEIQAKFAAIIASSDDAIMSKTLDGIITSWNPGAEKMFGYSTQEAVGQPMAMLIPPECTHEESQILARIARGEPVEHFETVRMRKDGKQINISATISPIKDGSGKIIGASKIARDITERKLSEDQIKHLNEDLEKQATCLETANKELEAFSYSVSHDLRAPLRAIDGFSRIFIEDYAEKLDDEGRRVLDVIRNNAQNMGQLIDDLLAFSRLGRKQIETSRVDMEELARDVCGGFATSSNSQINIEQLPETAGDKALLRQVFVNLISNAVKYSTTRGNTSVEVGGRFENGENIYYVQDNGVGFDMKYANKLFGVFQRLHSAEEFEGTGVGLAIVQRIVHRHGGRVWAEGEVNKGATFYFALPQDSLNQKELSNGYE